MAITETQRKILQQTIDDGGTLTIGGIDGRKFRYDVLWRLHDARLIKFVGVVAPHLPNVTEWEITEAGIKACKQGT